MTGGSRIASRAKQGRRGPKTAGPLEPVHEWEGLGRGPPASSYRNHPSLLLLAAAAAAAAAALQALSSGSGCGSGSGGGGGPHGCPPSCCCCCCCCPSVAENYPELWN